MYSLEFTFLFYKDNLKSKIMGNHYTRPQYRININSKDVSDSIIRNRNLVYTILKNHYSKTKLYRFANVLENCYQELFKEIINNEIKLMDYEDVEGFLDRWYLFLIEHLNYYFSQR